MAQSFLKKSEKLRICKIFIPIAIGIQLRKNEKDTDSYLVRLQELFRQRSENKLF
jgi:hypothetical protein